MEQVLKHTQGAEGAESTAPRVRNTQAEGTAQGSQTPQAAQAEGAARDAQPPRVRKSTKTGHARKSRYIPALDGLRAFAVMSVIFYHMGFGWAQGGLMGVTVFFVISGYLINGLLVAEHDRTGTINLPSFWLRRVRRLFPAIALAVVGTVALCTLFNHTLLDKMRPDILPSLFFYNNWWQIFHDVSYFEAAGSPSPLTHFWSLSIEEQFYVVWPLLLLAMYKLGCSKRVMIIAVAVLAIISGADMALLYDPHADPSRIYYGTDCRAVSLLIGVLLAFLWPSSAFGEKAEISNRDTGVWTAFNIVGIGSLVGLLGIVVYTNGFSSFPYYGGIMLTSLLAAVLIAVLAVPRTWLSRVFAARPLVWIGKRSYGMYLWHLPVLLLTTNPNSTAGTPWWMHVVQIALIFSISALSYTFVENPIRKGMWAQWWRERKKNRARAATGAGAGAGAGAENATAPEWHSAAGAVTVGSSARVSNRRRGLPLKMTGTLACFAVILAIACVGIFIVRPTDYAAQLAASNAQGQQTTASTQAQQGAENADASGAESKGGESGEDTPIAKESGPVYEPLLIGDSVVAGAIDEFYRVFPNGKIDAVESRNIWESPYADYLEAGQAGNVVIFCLGTNNAVVDWQIDDELLNAVPEDKKIIMVNTRNTLEWNESTNEAIARAPERHPNVILVDWFAASADHDEYFAGDGTHLTPEGAQAYIALIADAVQKAQA